MSGSRPSFEDLRAALLRWRKERWLIPESFASEARLENLESAYRVTVEAATEEHRWVESNGGPPPALGALSLPASLPDGKTLLRVPGSEREQSCAPCAGTGGRSCAECSGLGRVQCPSCRGAGCGRCMLKGTVECAPCGTTGKERCGRCGGAGKTVRAHVLEIVRSTSRAHRALGPAHPDFRERPRTIVDVALPDPSRLPPDLPPAVRDAALEMLRDVAGKSPKLRLRVEQTPVWGAEWSFGKRKGRAWFHGEPLRAVLPFPPRNVFVLATFVWLALMVPPAILLVYHAFRSPPPDEVVALPAVPVAKPVTEISLPPPPAAPLPAPPPKPPEGSADALVILAQGGVMRGRLRTADDRIVVTDADGEHSLQPWEVDTVLENAPARIREKAAAVEALEGSVRPGREEVVRLLLRVHRERDSWAALAPLCRAGELPPGEAPIDRLDALIVRLSGLLENPLPAAAAPPSPVPAVSEPPAAPPPDPSPALAALGKPMEPGERFTAASRLRDLAPALPAARDLVHAAVLVLSRDANGWGLERDELVVDSGPVKLRHVGLFESFQARYLSLRLPQGGRVTAFKEERGTWFVNLPGGLRMDQAECVGRRAVGTPAGQHFREHLGRFPPSKWTGLAPADHLRAAAALVEPASAGQDEQAEGLLRRIAAAHAAAVLEAGAPAEIEEARSTLRKLGFTVAIGERWERPDDRLAVRTGALLREGRPVEALSLASGGGERSFPARYASLAARILTPAAGREDLERLQQSLQSALALARTEGEGSHVAALQEALAEFRVCGRCGGDARSACTACRGQGSRRLTCGKCNGHGVVVQAGQGGGVLRCPSCKGTPDLGAQACAKCGGLGRVTCAACSGPFRLPRPHDLCRLSLCPLCGGQGGLGAAVLLSCPSCLALGVQLVPARRPDAVLR